MKVNQRVITRAFEVPGRFTVTKNVQLSSGGAKARVSIGMASETTRHLAAVTLCKGGIPIERLQELPWTGNKAFMPKGVHFIIDSFQFETNIGRNVVYQTQILHDLTTKIFNGLFLPHVIPLFAGYYSKSRILPPGVRYEFQKLFGDICVLAWQLQFEIPSAVIDTAFIPGMYGEQYSLAKLLEGDRKVYFTWEQPEPIAPYQIARNLDGTDQYVSDVSIVCLNNLPSNFGEFLKQRLGDRWVELKNRLVIRDEDAPDLRALSSQLQDHLNDQSMRDFAGGLLQMILELMPAINPLLNMTVKAARFYQLDGQEDRQTLTYFRKDNDQMMLNVLHPHINNLIEMFCNPQGKHRVLALHFLMREFLNDPQVGLTPGAREQLLTRDLRRFACTESQSDTSTWETLAEILGNGEDFQLD